MSIESLINEVVNDNSQNLVPETGEKMMEVANENREVKTDVTELHKDSAEMLNEQTNEFAQARSELHARIIGKDANGHNVSDTCGCNNACTHSAL